MSRSPQRRYLSVEDRLYIVFERDQGTKYDTIKERFKKKVQKDHIIAQLAEFILRKGKQGV